MKRLAELGSEVASSLDEARARRSAASRVRAKIVAREVPRLRTEWRRRGPSSRLSSNVRFGLVAALTMAAAIALTAFFAWPWKEMATAPRQEMATAPLAEPPLSFVVGDERGTAGLFVAAPATGEKPITFSDGSELRLAPTARVRVAEVAREGARVLVESGTVRVSVVHARTHETRWTVEAGPFEVRVTGTKFDVVYDPSSTGLVVRMHEGSVVVRGCGLAGNGGRRLVAGEELEVACKDDAVTVGAEDAGEAANVAPARAVAPGTASASARTSTPTSTSTSTTAGSSASESVMGLVRRGAHSEAMAAAEANGFGATCDALSGAELLLLADAARYAGRFDRATEALEITRRRFAGSDAAATAAFELGRIAMDIRRELPAAGDHFETYLRERPSGSLAREALGRAIEARSRGGDLARAERLAVRYLGAYPDGPHAKLARKLAGGDPEPRTP